ncbi:MAG: hypothetical protein KAI29_02085 [Cyclobacteriaceae bacterium]|nr:hypothetical protein [Cyclobacteriaceae bacterium]
MKKLGVLVIRGSGSSGFERQKKFVNKINKRLVKSGIDINQIVYEYIDWYEPLQSQQEILLKRMFDHPDLKLKSKNLRKLLISNIADLINYGGKPNFPDKVYEKTQLMLYNAIIRLQNQVGDNDPLIIIASSMGTEIMNNYIWDRQQAGENDPFGTTAFERFETLTGLFTFGNNIPIFSSSNTIEDLRPIQFPIQNTLPEYKNIATWENYYDNNDPLGYPVKFINEFYAAAKVEDIQIGVGNLLSFWNILSHFGYWTSRKLQKRITNFMIKVLETTA